MMMMGNAPQDDEGVEDADDSPFSPLPQSVLREVWRLCRCGVCGGESGGGAAATDGVDLRALPCLHVVCSPCLLQLITTQVQGASSKTYFPCPTCRQPTDIPSRLGLLGDSVVEVFPRDTFLIKLSRVISAYDPAKVCHSCTLRGDVTSSSLAVSWCTDCHEALCDDCARIHPPPTSPTSPTTPTTPTTPTSPFASSGHVIVSLEELRQLPLEQVLTRNLPVACHNHGHPLSLFCQDCGDAACSQCLATAHRKCRRCITVADALTGQEEDMAETVLRLQTLPPVSSATSLSASSGSTSSSSGFGDAVEVLEETVRSTEDRIRSVAQTMRDAITASEQSLLQELADTHQMILGKVEGSKGGPAKDHSKTLRTANDRLQFLLKYGSDVEILQTYSTLKEAMRKMDKVGGQDHNGSVERGGGGGGGAKTEEEEEEEELMFRVNFTSDDAVKVFQRDFQTLGHIQVEDCNSDDGLSGWGVTCTSRDEIIVVDCRQKKVQKFSGNGDLIDHIQISEEPRDVTCCGEKDVAITIMKKQIFVVTVSGSMTLKSRIKTQKQYDAIHYSPVTEAFLVSCLADTSLDVINRQGDVIQAFNVDPSGRPIFTDPRYVTFSREGNYVISDVGSNSVKCISPEGVLVYCYQPSGAHVLRSPQGLCVDKLGNVFVADYGNSRVQLINSEGAFQRVVLARESGLQRPVAIHMTSSSKLIVVQSDGMVKVFNYECPGAVKPKYKVTCWCPRCLANMERDQAAAAQSSSSDQQQ